MTYQYLIYDYSEYSDFGSPTVAFASRFYESREECEEAARKKCMELGAPEPPFAGDPKYCVSKVRYRR